MILLSNAISCDKVIGNRIGEEGTGMIIEALKYNSALTEMNLGGDKKYAAVETRTRI